MQAVTTIGLYIAKSVFQVHGVDAAGQALIRRQLKRRAVLGVLPDTAIMSSRERNVAQPAGLVVLVLALEIGVLLDQRLQRHR